MIKTQKLNWNWIENENANAIENENWNEIEGENDIESVNVI